ncbi:MAG TPA: hypothetical protein DIU00_19390 [Phycisphaerales bacterium]|nr:hypothetical protein [Phycisphaerales bacterium]
MEFYLKFDGPLKSNVGAKDKHNIREYLYPQLKNLWDIEPLNRRKNFLKQENKPSVLKKIDGIIFAPLICNALEFICQLDLIMLWPETQGVISKHGGDIDNRLKTLFDALQCPDINQIQPVKDRFTDKQPFFCLLEDDKLITSVNVKTHTLLCSENKTDISVLIHVVVKAVDIKIGVIGLSG